MTSRIDYDAVAPSYDDQLYRSKSVDERLLAFARQRGDERGKRLRVLDVACGTGNQILANLEALPDCEFVGVDASGGMLEVARKKSAAVRWVEASVDDLPFGDSSFDYVTCQFAYHHFGDVAAALREIARVLREGGTFVLSNVSPDDYRDSLFYRIFPGALERDLDDFLSIDELRRALRTAGFSRVSVESKRVGGDETLEEFREYVSVRANNSHLTAMSDEAYERGIRTLEEKIRLDGPDHTEPNPVTLVIAAARL